MTPANSPSIPRFRSLRLTTAALLVASALSPLMSSVVRAADEPEPAVILHPKIISAPFGPAPAGLPQDLHPPSVTLDGLFAAMGEQHIFTDAKAAADAYPNRPPEEILAAWNAQKDEPGFDLKTFVATWFTSPSITSAAYQRKPNENVRDYISGMWDVLTHRPEIRRPWSSLLPLPATYVVPGGRFSEIYYWDSYFTMIGLNEDDRLPLLRSTLSDLASLIDRYGHIPNGSRTYYLSRSQPAFFALMVDLLATHDGDAVYLKYLPQMQREYNYWIDGAATLKPGQAWRHAVRLQDGTLMVRPWDDRDTPRDESYPQDVATAASTHRPSHEVWRDLRGAAETGWDFSSRWLADRHTLNTINTTDLVTIEMNCAVAHLTETLAKAYRLRGNKEMADFYQADATRRITAIRTVLWDEKRSAFYDYNWKTGQHTDVLSAATAVPLFMKMATPEQAHATARVMREKLLKAGGLTATDTVSGQQWDSPNGWAPLEWMAIKGLNQYDEPGLAAEIARRWMTRVIATYEKSGVLLEKYDVVSTEISPTGGAGGGEYPMQVGFGWTNGTLLGLMNRYPLMAQQILSHNPLAGQATRETTSEEGESQAPPVPVVSKPTLRGEQKAQPAAPVPSSSPQSSEAH